MHTYYCLILSICVFGLTRCATAPMPMVVIPSQNNAVQGSFSFGNNGTNLNLAYVAKNNLVFDLSLQGKLAGGPSAAYDLGLGRVSDNKKSMLFLTFGYGRHEVRPFTTDFVYNEFTNVDAFRTSAYLNQRLSENGFLILRTSYYWGDAGQRNVSELGGPKHNFSSLALEPALFGRMGEQKRWLLGLGGSFSFEYADRPATDKKDLRLCPFWVGLGYCLEKKIR